jgi:hypothetical protein
MCTSRGGLGYPVTDGRDLQVADLAARLGNRPNELRLAGIHQRPPGIPLPDTLPTCWLPSPCARFSRARTTTEPPSRVFGRRRAYPIVPGGSRAAGTTRDDSRVHCEPIDQPGIQLCPGSIATVTPETFTLASPPARQAGYGVATHTGWPCAAPRPISTRFELVPRLRSFNTGSSRIPSDLARRTWPVWQYQTVPALSALLPALPGVSRIRLRSAPTRLLRQPGEEVLHLLRFPAPHGAPAPRGAPCGRGRSGRPSTVPAGLRNWVTAILCRAWLRARVADSVRRIAAWDDAFWGHPQRVPPECSAPR